jgi:hypothetical protein
MNRRSLNDLFPSSMPAKNVPRTGDESETRVGLRSLPACSGDACARALEKCGMTRFDEAAGVVWMECGATFFAVPACDVLPVETLADILAKSGLSAGAFVAQLDAAPSHAT